MRHKIVLLIGALALAALPARATIRSCWSKRCNCRRASHGMCNTGWMKTRSAMRIYERIRSTGPRMWGMWCKRFVCQIVYT
jgi:hypothetical protein